MTEQDRNAAGSVHYFLILGRIVGKRDRGDYLFSPERGWVADTDHEISDRLMGYDESEPDGSPYKMFNTSIMDEIESITETEAMARIANLRGA